MELPCTGIAPGSIRTSINAEYLAVEDYLTCNLGKIWIMDALRFELVLKVPDDLSVLGYGNIPTGAWKSFALTTLDPMIQDMVQQIVDAITDLIETGSARHHKRVMPELVWRDTLRR